MFSFFRKKPPAPPPAPETSPPPAAVSSPAPEAIVAIPPPDVPSIPEPAPVSPPARQGWLDRLKAGLRKTGSSIATVFTGTRIDEALYEELEAALLMADTGVKATE